MAETDKEAGQGPGESGVVVAANNYEKEEEGLQHCEVGLDEKFGLGQRLLECETVFLDQGTFLGAKIQFDLGVLAVTDSYFEVMAHTSSSSSEVMEA